MPLGLVLHLLENSDGVTSFDFPIKGDMNDPNFEYTKVLAKTVQDLLTNIAASPGNFLGDLVGFKSEKVHNISFKAKSIKLGVHEIAKLDAIAKTLFSHPNIELTVRTKLYRDEVAEKGAKELADKRGETIINYLVEKKFISSQRLRIIAAEVDKSQERGSQKVYFKIGVEILTK